MAGKKVDVKEWLTDEKLLELEECANKKMTDKDIARDIIGISEGTFVNWKKKNPIIVETLKKGRKPVGMKIQKSLYDLCDVQVYTETIEEITYDKDNNVISKHKRITTRETPPNVTAIIFALKNLMPDKWREKRDVKVDTSAIKEIPKLYEALGAVGAVENDVSETVTETSKSV